MAAMNMNQEQFEQATREEKPVLVDFWAPWCGYCRRIGPAYEKIGEEYADSLVVSKINIDEEPRLAGPRGSRTSQLWCCTGTERPWIPSSRPAQRQKSTVSFRKPWRNNGGFRYEQQSCL